MEPARPRSTNLTEAEEATVVESRRRTLLPLDDVLGSLRESVPALSRSALHRCLVPHGEITSKEWARTYGQPAIAEKAEDEADPDDEHTSSST